MNCGEEAVLGRKASRTVVMVVSMVMFSHSGRPLTHRAPSKKFVESVNEPAPRGGLMEKLPVFQDGLKSVTYVFSN